MSLRCEMGQAMSESGVGTGRLPGEAVWIDELIECDGQRDQLRSVLRAFAANLKQQLAAAPPAELARGLYVYVQGQITHTQGRNFPERVEVLVHGVGTGTVERSRLKAMAAPHAAVTDAALAGMQLGQYRMWRDAGGPAPHKETVMDKPTTDARLMELIGIFEEGTTGWPVSQDGSTPLSQDDIGDVYAWLQWAQAINAPKDGVAE
jgi:hypothetical protein